MLTHSTGTPTKAQKRRMHMIKLDGGCIACRIRDGRYCEPEIHHLLSGGVRIGHDASIGLCQWHHRGIIIPGWRRVDMQITFGNSLFYSPKRFHEEFGTDAELLEQQNLIIGIKEKAA